MASVRSIIAAMYIAEALGCAAWLSMLFTGPSLKTLVTAVALTCLTSVLHVYAVLADVRERLRRIASYAK